VIGLWQVTPDLAVAAAVYLIAGLLVRLRQPDPNGRRHVMLGVSPSLGYLAKAPLFPLAFAVLAIRGFSLGQRGTSLKGALIAFAAFVVTSAPYLLALSLVKGRFTLGDSGPNVYAWFVNGIYSLDHWHGAPPHVGPPKHPTRKVFDRPEAFEFATPVGGTYPPWYEPSYWWEGGASVVRRRSSTARAARESARRSQCLD